MKFILPLLSLILPVALSSQVSRAPLSPVQKIEQIIGFTTLSIEYSRPSIRGRKIFGDLVKYNEYWRTGANRNTKISLTEDVEIGGQVLDAGTYALFSRPGVEEWEIFFYNETSNWDVPDPIESDKIVLSTKVKPIILVDKVQTMSMDISNISESAASLDIVWEFSKVSIPIAFNTNEIATKNMLREFKRNQTDYHVAAVYYADRDLDLEQAKSWMETAIELRGEPHHWDYLEYAKILYKLGHKEKAIETAKKSLALSKAIKSKSGIEVNTENLALWESKK